MKDLLADPESFFERIADFGNTWRAFAVLGVAGLGYSLQSLVLLVLLGSRVSDFDGAIFVGVLGDFLQPFLVWGLFLVVVWILSVPLGGRLEIGQFVRTSAWALGPLSVAGPLWAVGRYLALRNVPVPPPPNINGFPEETARIEGEYLVALGGDPVHLVFRGLGILFVLLSFYLLVYAVVACSRLDRRQAAIATAPAALFYLAVAAGVIL